MILAIAMPSNEQEMRLLWTFFTVSLPLLYVITWLIWQNKSIISRYEERMSVRDGEIRGLRQQMHEMQLEKAKRQFAAKERMDRATKEKRPGTKTPAIPKDNNTWGMLEESS